MQLTLTQIPHPIHSSSEIEAILSLGATSIHSFPIRTTGQYFLHSCRHRFGLHLSELTMAIRISLSVSSVALLRGIYKNEKTIMNKQFDDQFETPTRKWYKIELTL